MNTELLSYLVKRQYKDLLKANNSDDKKIDHCERTFKFLRNGFVCTTYILTRHHVNFYLHKENKYKINETQFVYHINKEDYYKYLDGFTRLEKFKRIVK